VVTGCGFILDAGFSEYGEVNLSEPARKENSLATQHLYTLYLRKIFSPWHRHINERGHRLVADAIFNWISANNKSKFKS